MPRRIQVLPDALVNRIAAGEVVERPFSVVKELVENALDAGATRVEVSLAGGGKEWIRVTDDGFGMGPHDLEVALTRHATSKLRSADDLDAIATLGFRGEALPSIASVSRLRIVSREADAATGHELRVEGGRILELREAGAPVGTRVEVGDLFHNTPARRAFLKADGTELRHVADWMQRMALSRPDVAFVLEHDERVLLEAPPARSLEERAVAVLGRDVSRALFQVDGLEGEAALHGLAARPGVTRPSASALYLELNGRVIRDRGVVHAVVSAYGTLNPPGKYPIVVLHLELPLAEVDVNVHPAKTEVRFRDPAAIHRLVHHALRDGLKVAPWAGRDSQPPAIVPFPAATDPVAPSAWSSAMAGFAPLVGHGIPGFSVAETADASPPAAVPSPTTLLETGFFGSLRPIGQLHRTYLVCESDAGLVLVDQHAAHERVTFERLRKQWLEDGVSSQALLIPQPVDVGVLRARVAEERAALLERLGFGIDPFGGGSVLVTRMPALLAARGDAPSLLAELLEPDGPLVGEGGPPSSATLEEVLGRMACHGSVRAGRTLSLEEMRELLRSLDRTDFRGNCPHGRNVVAELSLAELERRVGRR